MSLTVGAVTRLCASKPPGLRNRMDSGTSKREPRRLVVWGTRVTKRPVGVFSRHAENERGAYLRGEAQVDEPDLATFGRAHRGFSA